VDTTLGRIMSNPQWPQNNSPWASQDPNWRPTQFQDAQGRNPHTPFGQQPPVPPSYQDLEPPRRPSSTLWIVAAVVAVIAVVVLGVVFLGGDPSGPDPTTSPSATSTAQPSPERTGNFIPFEGNGDGVFEIVNYTWSGDTLTARIRVEVDEGEYGFTVFAFANETRAAYDPVDPYGFTVRGGQPYEGEVVFHMPNADSTIVLATPSGRTALNALPVKAG